MPLLQLAFTGSTLPALRSTAHAIRSLSCNHVIFRRPNLSPSCTSYKKQSPVRMMINSPTSTDDDSCHSYSISCHNRFDIKHYMFENEDSTNTQDLALDTGDGSSGGATFNNNGGNWGKDNDDSSSDDDGEQSRNEILSKYGKTESDIPEDVRSLNGSALDAYLRATRDGLSSMLAATWSGWRRRVAADPDFPFKLLMEQTVGLGLTLSGMIAARGRNILNELDFALCDTVVGVTMNFVLVYLLTPVIGAKVGFGSSLPANLFAKGNYNLGLRLAGFVHKSALFSICGFVASLIGTSVSHGLVKLRRSVADGMSSSSDDNDVEQQQHPELPNLFANSLAWAGFMAISSSPRYQTVAGVERVLFAYAPETIAKFGSGMLRTGNNVLGGATWVLWAKAIGLQKTEGTDNSDNEKGTKEKTIYGEGEDE